MKQDPLAELGINNGFAGKIRIPNSAKAGQLIPYLKALDISKNYSNFGALHNQYINRLTEDIFDNKFNITAHTNGTQALISSIMAVAGLAKPEKKICLMPSYTFIATATAAISCGYEPYFVDIDETDLMMDLKSHRDQIPWDNIGLIVPTCPYGIIGHLAELILLAEQEQIPIVIDGAASFDTFPSNFPLGDKAVFCMSTHATKSFNTGEGGLALTTDPDLSHRIQKVSNFGLDGSRVSKYLGTNSKMSEYHAAVGLANLDLWPDHKKALEQVRENYIKSFQGKPSQAHYIQSASLANALVQCPNYESVSERLIAENIDHRKWYESGLHKNLQFKTCGKTSMSQTNNISQQVIGIPAHIYLIPETINYIAQVIAS